MPESSVADGSRRVMGGCMTKSGVGAGAVAVGFGSSAKAMRTAPLHAKTAASSAGLEIERRDLVRMWQKGRN